MFSKIREYFNSLSDAQQAVNTIMGVVAVVAGGWVIIEQFIKQLDISQKIAIGVVIFCLLVIFIIAFITWWRKHDVGNIPEYLSQLDLMLQNYVRDFDISGVKDEDIAAVSIDLGGMLKIDVWRMNELIQHRNKDLLKYQMTKTNSNVNKYIDPNNRTNDSLRLLLMISGTMNYRGVGLDILKNTDNYKRIYQKVKSLQRIVPSARANIKINEYFNWSTGLYSLLLGYKFITNKPDVMELLPPEERATTTFMGPQIEGSTATLISAVREALDKPHHAEEKQK